MKKSSLQDQIKKLKKNGNKLEVNHKKLQNEINGKNREIIQKNNLLDRIFSNTHILIAYLDINFNFIQVNQAYAKYNKKGINYFYGRNYFDMHPDQECGEIFKKVINTNLPYIVFEKKFNYNGKKNKKNIYWDWSLHPVKDRSGKAEGVILTLLDVTDRVKNQKEFENTKEKLNQSKRLSELGLLAATVAHELRNPLSVIQAALYNIDRKKENAKIESQIGTIEKKIIESERIITNLLTYAKIKIPDLKKVNIIKLLNESADAVKQTYLQNNIALNKIISPDLIQIIRADPFQISEVFNNIILNAYQSINKSAGIIDIKARTSGDFMEITVTDNGSGIKKEDMNRIFDPFFTRKSKGTGLGLSICREIINLHNGIISIESKLLKGTSITVKLPYGEI